MHVIADLWGVNSSSTCGRCALLMCGQAVAGEFHTDRFNIFFAAFVHQLVGTREYVSLMQGRLGRGRAKDAIRREWRGCRYLEEAARTNNNIYIRGRSLAMVGGVWFPRYSL